MSEEGRDEGWGEREANEGPVTGGEDIDEAKAPLLRPMKKSKSLNSFVSFSSLSASGTSLGMKTIGFYGSVVLTVNNITGAGMLTLPQVFQSSVRLSSSRFK